MITVKSFSQLILTWHQDNGRKNLPWQQPRTPYRVWLSEIMLQQTQVATVIPYFEKFIQHFPDVSTLANADVDEVLKYWAGLGYYARARNLHKTAQMVVNNFNGEFPANLELLESFPGIGKSTAGAILSLSMNQRATILDGNVKRVLTRLHAIEGWPNLPVVNKQLWALAEQHTPHENNADYTQAIMDLGATICTPKQPKCNCCPVQQLCKAYSQNNPEQYPTPKKAKALPVKQIFMLLLENNNGEFLLEKRPPVGIWGGLWSLPQCELAQNIHEWCQQNLYCVIDKNITSLPTFRHTFSHFHLDITPLQIKVKKCLPTIMESNLQVWYKRALLQELGLPAPVKKLLDGLNHDTYDFLPEITERN